MEPICHPLVGSPVAELETPCFLVDLDKVKANAKKIRALCDGLGLKLRVHVKTHKCIQIGDIQTFGEKRGICASTVKEAEYFFQAGYEDVLLTAIFTEDKMERIKRLALNMVEFHLMLDNEYGVDVLERHPLKNGVPWSVFLKLDCGSGRAGVEWDDPEALRLAQRISASKTITLAGLYNFNGNSYSADGEKGMDEHWEQTIERNIYVHKELNKIGIHYDTLSIGTTPSGSRPSEKSKQLTELHMGNYIFYDVQQTVLGSCRKGEVAVKVMTRVKGHYPTKNTLLVDCGFTALSFDGLGKLENGAMAWVDDHPELVFMGTCQEVGTIKAKEGALDYSRYPIGSPLYILPYHSCCTAMMFRDYVITEGDKVVDVWTTCNQEW